LTWRSAASASAKRSSDSRPLLAARAGDPVELALEDEVLAPGGLRVDAVLLADDADRAAHAPRLGQHVEPGHAALPASGRVSVVRTRTVVDLPAPLGPSSRRSCRPPRRGSAVECAHLRGIRLLEAHGLDRE
jgi:hypothetical protein